MKYIDADLLDLKIKEIEEEFKTGNYYLDNSDQAIGYTNALSDFTNIINSLQQEYQDIDKIKREWHNKGYLEGRKNAHIPARELGLPKSWDMQEQLEVDIEKDIDELWESLNTGHPYVIVDSYQDFLGICLHCFELGLNARRED